MPKIRKARQKKVGPYSPKEPGRAILPEDGVKRVHNTVRLHAQPARRPAPRVTSGAKVSCTDVERRLLTAMRTLRAMPDRERRFFIVKSSSPDNVQESVTAYAAVEDIGPRFQPSPADISDCLTALAWVRHLDRAAWQILWRRSSNCPSASSANTSAYSSVRAGDPTPVYNMSFKLYD